MSEKMKIVNQQKWLIHNEKGKLEITLLYEYLTGFVIGLLFGIYGFYINKCLKKNRTRRKGVLHGCLIAIFCWTVFSIILLQYCSYVLNLRNINEKNLKVKGKYKPKQKKILDFGDYVSQKFDFTPKIKTPATRRRPLHKYI